MINSKVWNSLLAKVDVSRVWDFSWVTLGILFHLPFLGWIEELVVKLDVLSWKSWPTCLQLLIPKAWYKCWHLYAVKALSGTDRHYQQSTITQKHLAGLKIFSCLFYFSFSFQETVTTVKWNGTSKCLYSFNLYMWFLCIYVYTDFGV